MTGQANGGFRGDTIAESCLLLALAIVAISQPVLEVLAKQPPFFLTRGSTWRELLLVAVGLLMLSALPALLHRWLSRGGPARGRLGFLILGPPLLALAVMMTVSKFLSAWLAIPLALLAVGIVARLYASDALVRRNTHVLSCLIMVAGLGQAIVFVVWSPAARAVRPQELKGIAATFQARTPLIILVLDELPLSSLLTSDGQIDAVTFPNFARLAGSSIWFRRATGMADFTDYALPPILTGQSPRADKVGSLADYPGNLLSWLNGVYRTVALEASATRLAPRSAIADLYPATKASLARDLAIIWGHRLLPEDLRSALPEVGHQWGNFGTARSIDSSRDGVFRRFTAQMLPSQPPPFYMLHSTLPHYPYIYAPNGTVYDGSGAVVAEGLATNGPNGTHDVWSNQWFADQAYQRHLLQLVFVDRLLGGFIEHLQSNGLWDDCLLVVTSDHGASFRSLVPHRIVDSANYMDLAAVPLMIKMPGQSTGRIDDRPARTVDIAPTVAAVLGERLSWKSDGNNLLADPPSTSRPSMLRKIDLKTFDFDYDPGALRRAVLFKERLFGRAPGVAGLYALGPYRQLLGREVAKLKQARPGGSYELIWGELFAKVDLQAKFQPNRLRANISSLAPSKQSLMPVAVAVNGTIRATSLATRTGGEANLVVLLPEDALSQGANEIALYSVSGPAHAPVLSALQPSELGYSLQGLEGQEVLRKGESTIPITSSVQGSIDELNVSGEEIRVRGWAGRTATGAPASTLLFFSGQERLLSGTTGWVRPDLERFGKAMKNAAFTYSIPLSVLDDPARLRVFAISDGEASELPRSVK